MVDHPDPLSGEYLPARLQRVQEILRNFPGSFWPNQYANTLNSLSHHQTAREIVEALEDVDWLFVATSTCGTLRGCAEYLRGHGLKTRIVAVDAEGSVIFGGPSGSGLSPDMAQPFVQRFFKTACAISMSWSPIWIALFHAGS
jgi:N-(2-amino-2-carboxyethyl)-L-glutamate synthase